MPNVLAWNPASNSLKFNIVAVDPGQRCAANGRKLLSGSVDNIGQETKLLLQRDGKQIAEREGDFQDFSAAVKSVLTALREQAAPQFELLALRVVHVCRF